jgi:hypothetical protein
VKYKPAIAFFIAKNGNNHHTVMHSWLGKARSLDEVKNLSGWPLEPQAKFAGFFTISR